MNVEVKVIKDYPEGCEIVKAGTKFVTDEQTGLQLQHEGKVKIIRNIPSHTQKKEVSHIPKKKY